MILRRICQLSLTRITHQVSRAFDLNVKGDICCPDISFLNFTSHFASIIHELKSRNALGILSHCTGGLFYIMNEIDCADQKHIFRGELALLLVIIMNSFGVVLMLYSGSGISAISSVPYAFSCVFPKISLGTWTYIFQGLLVLALMILRKKFVPQYLFSFVVGFAFSELLDVHESWINVLPLTPGYRVIYFLISYILLCIGIALSNRCKLPIIPTDLFPRELSDITSVTYSKIKVGFDVTCLAVTAGLTFAFLGHLDGLGIGTILAAFTMGKVIGLIGKWMDRHACFVSFMTQRQTA